jgi:hypothetical protein
MIAIFGLRWWWRDVSTVMELGAPMLPPKLESVHKMINSELSAAGWGVR